MRRATPLVAVAVALVVFAVAPPTQADDPALRLPDRYERSPYSLMSLTVGFPNRGRLVRGIRLKPRRYLKIKPDSQPRNYGHPALVKMLARSARDIARAVPGSVMMLGDLSRKGGGKLSKHSSHQSGRDADVAFYVRDAKGKAVAPPRFVTFKADGTASDGSGLVFDDWRNWLLIQSWLEDQRAVVQQVYVAHWLRKRLLDFASRRDDLKKWVPQAAALLAQPTDSSPHDDHFHVRIRCPEKQKDVCWDHAA